MRIYRVRGKNLKEALERARSQHGEGALVLSQEATDSGEVLLAVSERRQAANMVFPSVTVQAPQASAGVSSGLLMERGSSEVF